MNIGENVKDQFRRFCGDEKYHHWLSGFASPVMLRRNPPRLYFWQEALLERFRTETQLDLPDDAQGIVNLFEKEIFDATTYSLEEFSVQSSLHNRVILQELEQKMESDPRLEDFVALIEEGDELWEYTTDTKYCLDIGIAIVRNDRVIHCHVTECHA